MSKSFTYNVVLTKSHKVAKKLFFQESTVGSQVSRKRLKTIYSDLNSEEKDQTLLVSPFTDDGFISLVNEFPGGGKRFVTIRMLETSRVLETLLASTNAQEELVISRFKKKIKNISLLDNDTIDILKDIRPRFYLSYGVGDDVSEWAGPYIIDLADVNLKINSDGVRELELFFTPAIDSLKVFSNQQFIDEDLSQGKSVFDTYRSTTAMLESDTHLTFPLEGIEGLPLFVGNSLKPLNDAGDKFNFAIRRLMRRYLAKKYTTLPERNILVLFPQDLDKPASDENAPFNRTAPEEIASFQDRFQEVLGEYALFCAYPGIPGRRQKQTPAKRIQIAISEAARQATEVLKRNDPRLKQIDNRILELNDELESIKQGIISGAISPGSNVGASEFLDQQVNNINAQIDTLIKRKKEILEAIEIVAKDNIAKRDFIKEDVDKSLIEVVKARKSNQDAAVEGDDLKNKDITKITMGFHLHYDLQSLDTNILEALRPFYKFFKKLKTKTNKAFDPIIFEENDLKVCSLLKKHNLIADETGSVIVIGDRNLIQQLLYSASVMPELGSALSYAKNTKSLLGRWSAYRKEASRVYYPKKKARTSSFNEQVDFGPYVGFNNRISDESVVLMHNLKNSNVIDISFDNSPYKAELLSIANESVFALIDQGLEGNQNILDNTLRMDVIDYLAAALSQISITTGEPLDDNPVKIIEMMKSSREVIKVLKQRGRGVLRSSAKDFLDLLIFRIRGKRFADLKLKNRPGETLRYDADILRKVHSYVFKATVKTLPFFNTTDFMGRDCLLVGAPNRVVGSKIDRVPGKLPEPAVFSNNYNIYGYKHVINSSEAYSEFQLYNPEIGKPGTDMNINLATLLGIEEQDIELKIDLEAKPPGKLEVNASDVLKGDPRDSEALFGPPLDEYGDPIPFEPGGSYFDMSEEDGD